ncbi:uncharacterized protein LOC111712876 [Eurytemora carolleeae]|uniref:uncharacterized protein LOC111712876 n=1 Tax=Eurytemora carolleeae TaxID=1294199 RepID=UPI000C790F43|nr:uncharacterized protein LOC111712876 [Eurytemora carolleeae]|eukprot:XP_023343396.1 uncharacterized protein LOC111712876 [Eurytemora affinis]
MLDFRFSFCLSLNGCLSGEEYYDTIEEFMHSTNKKEFCSLGFADIVRGDSNVTKSGNDNMESCLKEKSTNIRICEKDIFERKEKMKNGKRIFEDAMKKLWKEKKKNKKKSKKKKKKKKKCKKNCKKDEKKKKKKKD